MDISTIRDFLAVSRDNYTAKYRSFKAVYDAEIKRIQHEVQPNTDRFVNESNTAREAFESSVQALRNEVKQFVSENIAELREAEFAKVRKVDSTAIEQLKAVAELPLSASELDILRQKYAPQDEYWTSRMLATMAEKNGINPSNYMKSAMVDTKLEVLAELEEQLDRMLADYDGEPTYKNLSMLHDTVLDKAERIYLNGWQNASLSDMETAQRAFMKMRSKSPAEQGIALMNIFKNSTKEVKNAIFYEIAKDEADSIDAGALKFAGVHEEFEDFKKKEFAEYTSAREGFHNAMLADSVEKVADITSELSDNKYYSKMLADTAERNKYVDAYLNESNGQQEAE